MNKHYQPYPGLPYYQEPTDFHRYRLHPPYNHVMGWYQFLNAIKPKVIRAEQGFAIKTLFCYVEGTGHRLDYTREEDWIEIVW